MYIHITHKLVCNQVKLHLFIKKIHILINITNKCIY